jgi:hypothetical protein
MMVAAADAHGRALHHQRKCRDALCAFTGIDGEADAFVTTALRDDIDASLPPALRERLQQRDLAQVAAAAADRAVDVLLQELSAATTEHQRSERAVSMAIGALVDLAKIAPREALGAARQRVAALEQACAAAPSSPVWQPLAAALQRDPIHADLVIEIGAEPLPIDPPWRTVGGLPAIVTIMGQDGTVERVPESEFFRRAREEREAAAVASAEPFAVREELARQRAQGI